MLSHMYEHLASCLSRISSPAACVSWTAGVVTSSAPGSPPITPNVCKPAKAPARSNPAFLYGAATNPFSSRNTLDDLRPKSDSTLSSCAYCFGSMIAGVISN